MVDPRPQLANPLVVADRLYLRGPSPGTLVRLPSPPLPARFGDQVAQRLTLYRHNEGIPVGGGLVEVALDLGCPWEQGELAEVALPTDVSTVTGPHHLGGRVRLWCMGRAVASSPIPAGVRPVVPLSARLDIAAASLAQEAANTGLAAVFATAEGWVAINGGGLELTVEVDVPGVRRALAGLGVLTPSEVADAVQEFLDSGLTRVSARASGDEMLPETLMVPAFLAAALFQPVQADSPWSLVPGLTLTRHAPAGFTPRARLREGLTLNIDGGALPWSAAAPVVLSPAAVQLADLEAHRVLTVEVTRYGEFPPDVVAPRVEARIDDGPVSTAPLTLEPAWLRLLPPNPTSSYSWRVAATRVDGTALAGPWTTHDLRHLAVGSTELSALSPQTST